MNSVPTLDLAEWRRADPPRRAALATAIDACLRSTGMFLIRNHGVPAGLKAQLRTLGREFFLLTDEQKASYAVRRPYDNGWRGLGRHQAETGPGTAPDLHEAFHIGPTHRTGDAGFDALYYPANRWPAEIPGLRAAADRYTAHMVRLAHDVLGVLATILGLPEGFFTGQCGRATWTQNVNWYPSLHRIGTVQDGQLRVGPHSDFGTLSLLDREPGVGGLEVWHEPGGWAPAPYRADAYTVVLGDLMNQWTDGRWRALRHRVLAPSALAPDEELISLVFFFEADPDAVLVPLRPPAGGGQRMRPLTAGQSILEKVGHALGAA